MDTGTPHASTGIARQASPTVAQAPYRFRTWDQRPGEARELCVTDLTITELVTLMRLGMRPALLQA